MAEGGTRIGLITSIIGGVAGLVVLVIIAVLIVNTLLDADLLGNAPTFNQTTLNESNGAINATGYQLGGSAGASNTSRSGYNISIATNKTSDLDARIAPLNWTLDTSTGIVTNATALTFNYTQFSYTYTYTTPEGTMYQVTSEAMGKNLSGGINQISNKIPTILLIGAVVILFGAIILLVNQARRTGLTAGGSSL